LVPGHYLPLGFWKRVAGAEKCGRAAKAYEIDFLAPDNATVEAKAKAVVKGTTGAPSEAATLSLNGADQVIE
jgi:hypothetical protein